MKITTTLKGQRLQNRVREIGINPNYWYPVAWAKDIKVSQAISVMVWKQAIAVYRDSNGQLHALEDACPHKGIVLHKGEVRGKNLVCPYHGWEFDGSGECVAIPYLPPEQKLPCAKAISYPVREKYDMVWVFPGDQNLAETCPFPEIPEYDNPNWFIVPIPAHFHAHFSMCNENTMDVFHGYLHRNVQGWFDPVLTDLSQTESSVDADYAISYKKRWLTQFFGLNESSKPVITRKLLIRYNYPHYNCYLEGISSMHVMRLPVSPKETRSFTLMFFNLPLPKWLLKPLQKPLATLILHGLVRKFLDDDIEMVESEQRTYWANPQRHYVEINPAIIALQRVLIAQYEKFISPSSQ